MDNKRFKAGSAADPRKFITGSEDQMNYPAIGHKIDIIVVAKPILDCSAGNFAATAFNICIVCKDFGDDVSEAEKRSGVLFPQVTVEALCQSQQ
ncbi:hypothetical protein [Acidocella sp.]|uniref:hypothetical protein n=1 Tax=Acidocella sp. TaxID=50710 RepID=UPI0026318F28|nr:hypothetical protein [Acidocella sp.]